MKSTNIDIAPQNAENIFNLWAIVPIGIKENNLPVRNAIGKPVVCPTYSRGTCMWSHVVSHPKDEGFMVLR